jgi:hypothetical protein
MPLVDERLAGEEQVLPVKHAPELIRIIHNPHFEHYRIVGITIERSLICFAKTQQRMVSKRENPL